MIHPHKWLFILVLIVLFSSGFARAQQIPPKPDKEEIAAVRGRLAARSVADQLNTLQSRENRAHRLQPRRFALETRRRTGPLVVARGPGGDPIRAAKDGETSDREREVWRLCAAATRHRRAGCKT